jgi:protein-glutamine gamma-glutamyltransferase
VRSARRQFWKVTTLDRFDGLRFVRSGTNAGSGHDLPLPLNDLWYAFATVTIRGLEANPLPSEQGTTLGLNSPTPIVHEADGTARAAGSPLRDGSSYTVLSYVPAPRLAELRAAPRKFPREYLRYTDFDLPAPGQTGLDVALSDPARAGRFLTPRTIGAPAVGSWPGAVPAVRRRILDSPYGPMYRLARKLAGGQRSPYDVAVAVESYLKATYGYNEQPPRRRYPLEAFLFEDSTGYCQQFSGAMALMLRMNGIPARVAVGFLPGSYDAATHSYQVRETDAHAWVEVYFSGTGWVPFNPTPSRVIGRQQRFPLFTSSRTVNALQALSATVGSARSSSAAQRPKPPAAQPRRAGAIGAGWIAAAIVLLLALVALAGRWLIGWVRLRRSLAGDCELACAELARGVRRFGYATAPTATLAQIERLVWIHAGAEAASYVRLLRERRYGEGTARVATLRDRRRLRRGLSARLGLDHRLRGLWALPPGTLAWRVRGLAGSAGRRDQVGGP